MAGIFDTLEPQIQAGVLDYLNSVAPQQSGLQQFGAALRGFAAGYNNQLYRNPGGAIGAGALGAAGELDKAKAGGTPEEKLEKLKTLAGVADVFKPAQTKTETSEFERLVDGQVAAGVLTPERGNALKQERITSIINPDKNKSTSEFERLLEGLPSEAQDNLRQARLGILTTRQGPQTVVTNTYNPSQGGVDPTKEVVTGLQKDVTAGDYSLQQLTGLRGSLNDPEAQKAFTFGEQFAQKYNATREKLGDLGYLNNIAPQLTDADRGSLSKFTETRARAAQVLATEINRLSGTAAGEGEVKRLQTFLPSPDDSYTEIKAKVNGLIRDVAAKRNASAYALTTNNIKTDPFDVEAATADPAPAPVAAPQQVPSAPAPVGGPSAGPPAGNPTAPPAAPSGPPTPAPAASVPDQELQRYLPLGFTAGGADPSGQPVGWPEPTSAVEAEAIAQQMLKAGISQQNAYAWYKSKRLGGVN